MENDIEKEIGLCHSQVVTPGVVCRPLHTFFVQNFIEIDSVVLCDDTHRNGP